MSIHFHVSLSQPTLWIKQAAKSSQSVNKSFTQTLFHFLNSIVMKRSVFDLLMKVHTDKLCEFWAHLHFSVRKKKLSSLKWKMTKKPQGSDSTHFYHNSYKPKEGAASHWETVHLVSQSTLRLSSAEPQQPWVPRPDTEDTVSPTHTSWVMGQ